MVSGLLLLKLSTSFLAVSGFAIFSQFMLFSALLNMVAIGGAQNGIIRQAAAADDPAALSRVQGAALAIWGMETPVTALLIALASPAISHILIGTSGSWWVVVTIALLALAAGPGQIWCSLLSGRKRVTGSLLAQALGLLVSTVLAACFIVRGDPVAAIIGFAGGALVTLGLAWLFVSRLGLRLVGPRAAMAEVRILLRYSVAFVATTGFSSIMLFGLRSLYRTAFGTSQLGYWLAANRISDMSTQLLGLFMIQFFVPHLAMLKGDGPRRGFILRCWAAGTAMMGTIPLVFSLAPRPLVHIFLSDAYLPAIPAIRTYMIGDVFRVWVCLAMYTAFARGRPARYAGIEIATLATMAVITFLSIEAGEARAPFYGYAGAYGLVAIVATAIFLLPSLTRTARSI
jgi:O-antigen/teichoic acid export membrane protein